MASAAVLKDIKKALKKVEKDVDEKEKKKARIKDMNDISGDCKTGAEMLQKMHAHNDKIDVAEKKAMEDKKLAHQEKAEGDTTVATRVTKTGMAKCITALINMIKNIFDIVQKSGKNMWADILQNAVLPAFGDISMGLLECYQYYKKSTDKMRTSGVVQKIAALIFGALEGLMVTVEYIQGKVDTGGKVWFKEVLHGALRVVKLVVSACSLAIEFTKTIPWLNKLAKWCPLMGLLFSLIDAGMNIVDLAQRNQEGEKLTWQDWVPVMVAGFRAFLEVVATVITFMFPPMVTLLAVIKAINFAIDIIMALAWLLEYLEQWTKELRKKIVGVAEMGKRLPLPKGFQLACHGITGLSYTNAFSEARNDNQATVKNAITARSAKEFPITVCTYNQSDTLYQISYWKEVLKSGDVRKMAAGQEPKEYFRMAIFASGNYLLKSFNMTGYFKVKAGDEITVTYKSHHYVFEHKKKNGKVKVMKFKW
eukprot:g2961.t1